MFAVGAVLMLAGYSALYVAGFRLAGAQDTPLNLLKGQLTRSGGTSDSGQSTGGTASNGTQMIPGNTD